VQLVLERVELGVQGALALAQRGHPGAELVERDELLPVGLDQPGDRAVGAGEVMLERVTTAAGGVLGAQRVKAAVDLSADELGVLQQPSDLGPDEPVELVGPDRPALADAPERRRGRLFTGQPQANAEA
jgi:hypothetical protein